MSTSRMERAENILRLFDIFSIEENRMVIEDKDRGDFYIEADHEPSRYVLVAQTTGVDKDFLFYMFDHLEDALNFASDDLDELLAGGSWPVSIPRIAILVCDLDDARFIDVTWSARRGPGRLMSDWE